MDLKCFIVVPPGSEGWAEKELIEHGAEESQIKRYPGGFEFPAALGSLPHWHSSLKIPVRLLVRLFEGEVTTWEDLGSALSQVPWSKFFKSPPLPKLHISSRSSKLFHKQQLSDRAERWFKARAKGSGVAGGDVYLRLFRDQLTVSLDATGDALFKRGAKQEVGKAPLRENLAALMLKLVTQGAPPELMKRYELVDPMAGSGTLLIEAMGGALTPRPFAFESWPAFGALKKQPSESTSSWGFAHLLAIDKDSAQFGQLEKNLAPFKRKGHRVTWLKEDSLKGAPQLPGGCLGRILVVNPPFGGRVKSSEKPVQSLSKLLENFKPWRAAFIVPESWKIRQFEGYRLVERLELDHGGLKVQMVALAQEMPLALGPIAAEVASDHQIEQHHD